jgi:hypothetical protein
MRFHDTARPSLIGLVFGGLATAMACLAYWLTYCYDDFVRANPDAGSAFVKAEVPGMGERLTLVVAGAAILFLAVAMLGFIRCRLSLFMARTACWSAYVLFLYGLNRIGWATSIWFETGIPMEGRDQSHYKIALFYTQWDLEKWYVLVLCVVLVVHLVLHLRRTINLYTGRRDTEPAIGDRILENLRTHGADPTYVVADLCRLRGTVPRSQGQRQSRGGAGEDGQTATPEEETEEVHSAHGHGDYLPYPRP